MFPDLAQYLWILWLVLALIFIVIELLTLEFTFLMLATGALIGGLGANLLGWEWWLQILLATVLAGLLIFTIRPLLLKTLRRGGDPTPSNVDALYGMAGRVLTDFVDGDGMVKLANGETWTSQSAAPLKTGDRVTVTRVLGSAVEVAPQTVPTEEG